jgi:hypothetical protein
MFSLPDNPEIEPKSRVHNQSNIPQMTSKFVEIVPPSHRKGTVSPLQPSESIILDLQGADE